MAHNGNHKHNVVNDFYDEDNFYIYRIRHTNSWQEVIFQKTKKTQHG